MRVTGETFEAMVTLVQVLRSGSLTAAAHNLGITPSSVSRRISALEAALDVALLERTTRRVVPTEAGRLYVERAASILAAMQDLDQTVASLAAQPRGKLRITAPIAFGERHLLSVLPVFLAENGELEVELVLGNERLDLVANDIDVAIRMGGLRDSSNIAFRLAKVHRVLCASPAYLARTGGAKTAEDLHRLSRLVFRRPNGVQAWTLTQGVERRMTVEGAARFTANTSEAILRAAVLGMGIAMLPTWLVASDIAAGRLERVLPDWSVDVAEADDGIWTVYPRGRRSLPKVEAFTRFLREWVGRPPRWDRIIELTGNRSSRIGATT